MPRSPERRPWGHPDMRPIAQPDITPSQDPWTQTTKVRRAEELKGRGAEWLSQGGAVAALCFLWDLALWPSLYAVLSYLRHDALGTGDAAVPGFQWSVCMVQFLAILLGLFIVGGYDRRTNFLSLSYMSEHLLALAAAAALGGLLVYTYAGFEQSIRPSRGVLLSSLAAFAPLSLIARRSLRLVVKRQLARSHFIVLGTGEQARHFYRSYLASAYQQQLHFVDPDPAQASRALTVDMGNAKAATVEVEPLGHLAALAEHSSGIIIAEDVRQMPQGLLDWLTRLHYEEIPVYTLETFYEQHWRRVPTYAIDPTWPLRTECHLANVSAYSHAKRLFDVALALAALVLAMPLFAVLVVLIRWESGAPVLFRQQRVGRDRQPFELYKFRTMFVRAPEAEGSLYTRRADPRITPLGHWLRKLRLDELPQLWNVLRGDMSLIGPRAEWDRLVDGYEKEIPFYHFRHLVKPGITGWAQVNYPYGANLEDTIQKLKFDLYYIRYYSLRLDAMIVLKTLHTMLWGKGQ